MKEVPRVISFGKTNNMKQNISKTKEKKCCIHWKFLAKISDGDEAGKIDGRSNCDNDSFPKKTSKRKWKQKLKETLASF